MSKTKSQAFRFCVFALSCALLLTVDGGSCFDYPDEIPPLPSAGVNFISTLIPLLKKRETPIVVYLTALFDVLGWQCIAHYSSDTLDFFTDARPIVDTIPSEYHSTETRFLCTAYAFQLLTHEFVPDADSGFVTLFQQWNLDYIDLDSDIAACQEMDDESSRNECLRDTAAANGYCPETIASIITSQIAQRSVSEDGWNRNGNLTPYGECTANCREYRDFTMFSETYEDRSQQRKAWQPLLEDDSYGFFFKQTHVVAHIGYTAKPIGITQQWLEESSVKNPRYHYTKESELVMQRLAQLDDEKKALIELFDDKLTVLFHIVAQLIFEKGVSWEEYQFWLTGVSAATHDATLLAWRSKVEWSLIRPTTFIKRWGDTKIETWGGPYQGTQEINAADFEAYLRIMPHSEYPSGSSCICQALTDFTQMFVENVIGDQSLSISATVAAGSSRVEPGTTPASDITLQFSGLDEYNEICGQSRLWGGMHFTASVEAGQDLASGVGKAVFEKMQSLNPSF